MGVSLCRLLESNIHGARAVFSMYACHVSHQVLLALVGVFGLVVTRDCTGCLAGPPLCSVVITGLLGAGSAL